MIPRPRLVLILTLILTFPISARAASLVDRVTDGPGAEEIRAAFTCLEKAESLEQEKAQLEWYERGRLHAEKALELDPGDANAHFALFANWGRIVIAEGILWNAHHIPELRSHLDRTLELDPDHAPALAAKGGLYFRLPRYLGGNPSKAEALLRRAARLDPRSAGTRVELAAYYSKRKDYERARRWATEALGVARAEHKPHHEKRARKILARLPDSDDVRVAKSH